MTGLRPNLLVGLVAFAFAAGATAAQAATASVAATQLGQNFAGESCHASGTAAPTRPLDIICGASTDASGRLQVVTPTSSLPAEPAAHRDAILRDAKTIAGGLGTSDRMTCDGGQWLGEAGSGSALFLCTLTSNSWPRIVVVSGSGRTLYRAEGLPALLPVLQAAIANASGHPAVAAETQAGQKLLEAKLPREVLHAGGADFSSYKQFVELGRLYSGADNYAGAETAYRHALDLQTRLFGPKSTAVGETIAELALQVSNQGRFDEAAQLFHRATPIIESSSSASARARLASYLALDAANQRHFTDALKFARDATAARRAEIAAASGGGGADSDVSAPPVSRGELAHSLRIEAEMALRLDDLAGARAAAEEALWIVSEEPGLPLWWRSGVVSLMGEINERQGRVVTAERDFKDALALNQKLFGDTAPTALAELRIGRFYSDQQVYPAALTSFRAALAILAKDRIARSEIVPDQIVPFIAAADASSKDPQQRAVLAAEVFQASQLVNSDVADQTIARAAARQAAGNPALAELVRQAQEAQRARDNARMDLAAEFAKPDDERNAARERKLADDLKAASARADALSAKVEQTYPDYAKLAEPGPVRLADLQSRLQPREAFLSFVIGVKGSYALLVTSQGLKIQRLDIQAPALTDDIADLRRAFVPQLGRLPEFSLKSSYALYQKLLAPLEGDLGATDYLIVAVNGDLASLPLSLLVTAAPTGRSNSDAAWLIRRMALSQVPSPGAFLSLRGERENHAPAPRPFLGVGDPTFTGTVGSFKSNALDALAGGCRESGPIAPELLRALPPLHDTAGEVRAVANMEGGNSAAVLLGPEATESNLRAHPLDQYAVLYFATHGLLPGELHCQAEPGLVLSPPGHAVTSTNADGLLEAGEIAALKLNADLVVLSACNTAAAGGGRFGGGALEGLADAFFNAGARAVLASHWEVPSGATVKLMTGVFDRLGHDRMRGLAEGLRQSQLALASQPATAHPFYWAAFTVIGDGAALTKTAGALQHVGSQGPQGGRS